MLFNSYEFIFLFLPLSFITYFFLLEKRLILGAKGFLVFASLFFYSWWDILYLPLILSSMLFNYVIGNSLNSHFKQVKIYKKTLLTIGIIANLALLAYFKYTDFFISNVNFFSDSNFPLLYLALPLAISFFTFQQIAYLVDSYREETAEYDFLNYALFVTFFPQLIAGPIVHHAEMMPQFASRWNLAKNYKNIVAGLFIFSIGLFKKVVIADTFSKWATNGFDKTEILTLFEAWATSLSYTFQLYFDFSGYTDMAIGAALLFNIKLPINFNSPYKAKDIQDFWRRWHITLSRFLKDYVYIPLGGNKKGNFRMYGNLITTFILGGLWHGAGWTFVLWGLMHGIALVIHRAWQNFGFKMNSIMAWFITFNFVNIAWVFFRAREFEDAIKVIKGMFGLSGIIIDHKIFEHLKSINNLEYYNILSFIKGDDMVYLWIFTFMIIIVTFKNSNEMIVNLKSNVRTLFASSILFIFAVLSLYNVSEFIYFNF